ncbi:hydroxyacid dehydrogenase [Polynucleobacter tropicus]|uniref:Hydroxyacid dehydrogenase n=1 Tax=Polynucleobacter tropicus TaxID=1743174 RepID=A0A6M9PR98_9BURK|nr:2-hydroxyacid dehydrogenase [Polynucleobacter tropicus]QKM64934.1 hydroxyacid dehydrogenase [Polynucleobacter tropicus]
MTKLKVIQNSTLPEWLENQLKSRFDVFPLWSEKDPEVFLAKHGAEYEAVVSRAAVGVSEALIQKLPSLKVISSFGVGYDKVAIDAAKSRGIQVGYTPNVLNDCVADIAFGLLIDVARQISAADRYAREGQWLKGPYPMTTRVSGKKLGILGLGRIGQVIAKRASGFDMEIRYHNRKQNSEVPYQYEPSLIELAKWCDFLVVASAGGEETANLVSTEVFEVLGPKGYLINIARGTVVDELALAKALKEKRIAGAGLDVYKDEPNIPNQLLELDNVVLLPHVASATHETRQAMSELVFENLVSYTKTGKVKVGVPGTVK